MINIENLELKALYQAKVKECVEAIWDKVPELTGEYIFTYGKRSLIPPLAKDDLNGEAFCYPSKNEIHLNESVLRSRECELKKVLIHEMLHCKYPDNSESEIINKTEQLMPKVLSMRERIMNI